MVTVTSRKNQMERFFIILTPLGSYYGIKGFNFLVVQIIRKFKFFNMSIFKISNITPCFFLLRDKINFEWPKLVSIGHCPRPFSKLFLRWFHNFVPKILFLKCLDISGWWNYCQLHWSEKSSDWNFVRAEKFLAGATFHYFDHYLHSQQTQNSDINIKQNNSERPVDALAEKHP